MNIKSSFCAATALLLAMVSSKAAISISSDTFTYSQSFDALSASGTNQTWTNDSTLTGWSLFTAASTAITQYDAGTGTSTTGKFYSYGASSNTDRALGGLGSGGAYFGSPANGAIAGYIAVALANNTGGDLEGIAFKYNGEQWRNGGNSTFHTMVLEYGFGASFSSVTTWTAPGGSFDFTGPVATAIAAVVDGNAAGLVTNLGGTLTGLTWANGATLWIRWIERNESGNDHGLAIDNFAITAVPEPGAALLGGIGMVILLRRRR